ncbi:BTB/POZ and MATH domain-containing protein 2 [Carex littledalei]|uniref:BTB/POZ and MATH domain-containing protein 2 n=1 Tax=Carex littledalei TaxID=544730 RepID=A0A833VGU3_9POAL|nr:BTB/POZ and MATH domain-containing protein 2 [Carex littledalei]
MASSYTTSEFQMKPTTGTHRVKIHTSLTAGIKSGRSIQCGTFTVGEYQWAILYYPQGTGEYSYSHTYMPFYVELLSEGKDVDVFLCFSLVDQNGIASNNYKDSKFFTYNKKGNKNGFSLFSRAWLDRSEFVKDDSFTVECSLKILEPSIEEGKNNNSISVPPSNMHQHLHNLLQSGEGADISFKVKGETFPAHRIILASRSSVFRAELFGSMSESTASCIEIQDIEPQIFKALLQFIYTDMFPPSDDHTGKGVDEDIMAQHLIVAADRYALDRLRLICEETLAKKINADNVVTTLVLAAQHNCQQLKELCLDYISSSKILHSLIETDVFASFMVSCPSIYKELLKKVTSNRRT